MMEMLSLSGHEQMFLLHSESDKYMMLLCREGHLSIRFMLTARLWIPHSIRMYLSGILTWAVAQGMAF
jgi:hypothetical protein